MALYTQSEQVKLRLIGKVQFTEDEEDQNKMSESLLRRLINEAEAEVEMELSPRYSVPFVTDAGGEFRTLPERPTREIVRTLCELKAVTRVLETEFGRSTVVNGENYRKDIDERFGKLLDKVLKRKTVGGEETERWYYPPLPGLQLAAHNAEGDDGFSGQILVTSNGDGDYPAAQINNPAENLWNGFITPTDKMKVPQ
jgi:hypothetical protein